MCSQSFSVRSFDSAKRHYTHIRVVDNSFLNTNKTVFGWLRFPSQGCSAPAVAVPDGEPGNSGVYLDVGARFISQSAMRAQAFSFSPQQLFRLSNGFASAMVSIYVVSRR
jgi:hypothetical protein